MGKGLRSARCARGAELHENKDVRWAHCGLGILKEGAWTHIGGQLRSARSRKADGHDMSCPYDLAVGRGSRAAGLMECLRWNASRCAAWRNASVPPARVTESTPITLAYCRQSAGLAPRMNW